jgi:hypothetical protein
MDVLINAKLTYELLLLELNSGSHSPSTVVLDKSTERKQQKITKRKYKRERERKKIPLKERRPTLSNSLSAPKYADCACVQLTSCRNGTPAKKRKKNKTNKTKIIQATGKIIKTKQ